jgi:hypothetical protein
MGAMMRTMLRLHLGFFAVPQPLHRRQICLQPADALKSTLAGSRIRTISSSRLVVSLFRMELCSAFSVLASEKPPPGTIRLASKRTFSAPRL